jgi:hypothetical protein
MNIPPCANNLEGSCERSDTYVEREGDTFFTIRCRTCKGVSVWPKDRAENAGRYQAFLHHQAMEQQRIKERERQTLYSIPGASPGEKSWPV